MNGQTSVKTGTSPNLNKKENLMITKHYPKSIVRAALLLALTICITGLGPLFSSSARAGSGSFCINDVSGNYVDQSSQGWDFGSRPDHFLPRSLVGLITFTPGTGTFHEDAIGRVAGTNFTNVVDGNYTVDATGHGTMTWLSPIGDVKHRDFYIVHRGAELKWINTDPPSSTIAAANGTMTKQ